jgi:hypothetical protein
MEPAGFQRRATTSYWSSRCAADVGELRGQWDPANGRTGSAHSPDLAFTRVPFGGPRAVGLASCEVCRDCLPSPDGAGPPSRASRAGAGSRRRSGWLMVLLMVTLHLMESAKPSGWMIFWLILAVRRFRSRWWCGSCSRRQRVLAAMRLPDGTEYMLTTEVQLEPEPYTWPSTDGCLADLGLYYGGPPGKSLARRDERPTMRRRDVITCTRGGKVGLTLDRKTDQVVRHDPNGIVRESSGPPFRRGPEFPFPQQPVACRPGHRGSPGDAGWLGRIAASWFLRLRGGSLRLLRAAGLAFFTFSKCSPVGLVRHLARQVRACSRSRGASALA